MVSHGFDWKCVALRTYVRYNYDMTGTVVADVLLDIDRREAVAAKLLVGVHDRLVAFGEGASSTPAWAQWRAGQRESLARGRARV